MNQKGKSNDSPKKAPLDCIVVEPEQKANAVLIGLHGLGTSGEDFQAISSMLHFAKGWNVKMIFPHAPQIPVTVNQHYIMPAWYDIKKMDLDREIDEHTVEISRQKLLFLIEQEIKNKIDSKKIILAGFSQGGAMAAKLALHFDQPLGGLMILSAYLLDEEQVRAEKLSPQNRNIPIFMGHGTLDEVVPCALAQKHQTLLKKKHYDVTWKTYENMGHSVCPDEMKDVSQWLKSL